MGSNTLDLLRKVPINKRNYIHPWLRFRVRWHHRFKKEDFRTLDRRNQENAGWLCQLIEKNRVETSAYKAKWMTVLGNKVLDLAFLGPDVEEAKEELEDIFFVRYQKQRNYHIEKLYNEIVPQLEFVEGDLINTQFLGFTNRKKLKVVTELANNGLPPLPIPEECYQYKRPLTYPEILAKQSESITEELGISDNMALNTSMEMLSLLPQAKNVQAQRDQNTQLDIEGGTLAWQAERIQREIDLHTERHRVEIERNERVTGGETTRQYRSLQRFGYRITLPPHARSEGLRPDDYNNGYEQLYTRLEAETER